MNNPVEACSQPGATIIGICFSLVAVKPAAAPSEVSSVPTADLKDMLSSKARSMERAKPALHQLEDFQGGRSHYRDWKLVLQAQQALYSLRDQELTMAVYLSWKGEARQILNQLDIGEMTNPGGLGPCPCWRRHLAAVLSLTCS